MVRLLDKKLLGLAGLILICIMTMLVGGCSNKTTYESDPDALKAHVAAFEKDYIAENGDLTEDNVKEYLKAASVDVMTKREYQLADAKTFIHTVRFTFMDDTVYLYTPDGFDPDEFDADGNLKSDTDTKDESKLESTGINLDSDIPNPGIKPETGSGTIGGSAIQIDPSESESDKSKYEGLPEDINPDDYSDEELRELYNRIGSGTTVDDEETDDAQTDAE